MPELDVFRLRSSDEYRREIRREYGRQGVHPRFVPIAAWGAFIYAVLSPPQLVEGVQRLEVVDLTDLRDVARFSRSIPEQGWDEESRLAQRDTVLLLEPEEGHTSIVLEDGGSRWVSTAVLTVRLVPGTPAESRATRDRMMEELEASVDAGGSLLS